MPDPLKEYTPASPVHALPRSQQGPDDWVRQICETIRTAQDQRVFRIVEGGRVNTYGGLRRDTDEDAQSEVGARNQRVSVDTLALDATIREWYARERATVEEYLRTGSSLDAEPEVCKAKHSDQPNISGEIAEDWDSDRVADELLELDAENNWPRLRELILTAEDLGFTAEQSAQLAPRLLELARQHRGSNEAEDAPAVLSAIRTGASMLRPNEAGILRRLLEPGSPIDTSLVSLKMLGRIFEAQPPREPDQHTDLAGDVRGIAELLLNSYAIVSSQSAAMAQLAVYALAAMASSETLGIVRIVRRLNVSWFTRQTARELRELRSAWNARSVPAAPAVLDLLDQATRELETT